MKKVPSRSKKITDEIVEWMIPKPLEDPDNDVHDDSVAKTAVLGDSDLDDSDEDNVRQLSEFRKRNVQLLKDVDNKYRGSIVSRNELDDEEDEEGSLQQESENEKLVADDDDYEESDEDVDDEEGSVVDSEEDDPSDSNSNLSEEDEKASVVEEQTDGESTTDGSPIESNLLRTNKNSVSTNIKKGLDVQNQLKLWEKMLEVRIHSQKIISIANSLPPPELFSRFLADGKLVAKQNSVEKCLGEVLDKMTELQKKLISQFDETKTMKYTTTNKRTHNSIEEEVEPRKKARLNEYCTNLDNNYKNYHVYVSSVIQKWNDRTNVFSSMKSKQSSNDYGIVRRIENLLDNKGDLIKKSQLHKGGYSLFAPKQNETIEIKSKLKTKEQNGDLNEEAKITDVPNSSVSKINLDDEYYSTEIYDDTDFYHQILRELIEFKSTSLNNPIEISKQFSELEKLRKKMKKTVDTRASKGRKIRYVVHKKLVNFMAPNPQSEWTHESKNELFSSLFGKVNGPTTSK